MCEHPGPVRLGSSLRHLTLTHVLVYPEDVDDEPAGVALPVHHKHAHHLLSFAR